MPRRVVVLGAGYGGLIASQRLARQAAKRGLEVTLVDCKDYHLLLPLIHRTSCGDLGPSAASIALSRLVGRLPLAFVRAVVQHIDPQNRRVETSGGTLSYDRLVVALGSETQFFGIAGMQEHALTLKSMADVCRIRQHLCAVFRRAAACTGAERASLLHVLVGGGGFTGVEVACELADSLPELARACGVSPAETRISVAEALPTILQGFPPALASVAGETMRRKGIDLRLGEPVVSVDADGVTLKSGERVEAGTIIWVAGIKANSALTCSGLRTGPGQRVVVNPFLQSVDHADIYVIGDAALAMNPGTGRPVAASGQNAVAEAFTVAHNILEEERGRARPFRPHISGEIVSLGRGNAVGHVYGVNVRGRIAYEFKRLSELRYIYRIGGPMLAMQRLRLPRQPFICEGGDEQAR